MLRSVTHYFSVGNLRLKNIQEKDETKLFYEKLMKIWPGNLVWITQQWCTVEYTRQAFVYKVRQLNHTFVLIHILKLISNSEGKLIKHTILWV